MNKLIHTLLPALAHTSWYDHFSVGVDVALSVIIDNDSEFLIVSRELYITAIK